MNWTSNASLIDDVNPPTLSIENVKSYLSARDVSKVATPIVIAVLLFLGVFGNVFVIYVTITTQRVVKHPLHSLLVLNLAVADLLYLFSSALYQAIAFTFPYWIYGDSLCPVLHFLNIQTMSVSIFTMCSLAVMRYLALLIPFKMENLFIAIAEKNVGFLIIIIVWLLGSVLSIPNAVFYRTVDHNDISMNGKSDLGVECLWLDQNSQDIYRVALVVTTFALPLILVTVMYFYIGREVLCFMNKNSRMNDDRREYLKTTMVIFFLVLAFLVCWFPYHFFELAFEVSSAYNGFKYACPRLVMRVVASCMSYAHACVNPIIYSFATSGFRQSLFLDCKRCPKIGGICACSKNKQNPDSTHRKRKSNSGLGIEMTTQGESDFQTEMQTTKDMRRVSSPSLKRVSTIHEETDNLLPRSDKSKQ